MCKASKGNIYVQASRYFSRHFWANSTSNSIVTCDSERLKSIYMISSALILTIFLRYDQRQVNILLLVSEELKIPHFLKICFLLLMQLHDSFWCPSASCRSNQMSASLTDKETCRDFLMVAESNQTHSLLFQFVFPSWCFTYMCS